MIVALIFSACWDSSRFFAVHLQLSVCTSVGTFSRPFLNTFNRFETCDDNGAESS